jgi:prevent-host-death family protein
MTSRMKRSKSSRSSRRPKRQPGLPIMERPVRRAALAEVKDDLSRFLRLAESEEIIITRHGKPAAVLIGFESEDDWFDYRLEHHPEFLQRVAKARGALRSGRGVRLEDLPS